MLCIDYFFIYFVFGFDFFLHLSLFILVAALNSTVLHYHIAMICYYPILLCTSSYYQLELFLFLNRILPVSVEVESATLQLLFSDLISDLKFVDRAQTIASTIPHRWIAEFNRKIVSPADRNMLVDVYRSQIVAQATKMYIEKLLIHPMKITLTFLQTPFPRKRGKGTLQAAAINILTSLAGVDRMQLRLKSFEVDDVLESRSSLIDLIVHKTVQDLQSQLAQIAG